MKKILTIFFLLTTISFSENLKYESQYTNIDIDKDCTTTKIYELGMGGEFNCGKFANLNVEVFADDLRHTIDLIRDGKRYNLDFVNTITTHFTELGKKIEWRYVKGQEGSPTAMIVRLYVDEGALTKDSSYLVVSKITKDTICVVKKIPAQINQNELAREVADRASNLSCIVDRKINERIY